jgi:hypothetical protein
MVFHFGLVSTLHRNFVAPERILDAVDRLKKTAGFHFIVINLTASTVA